MSYCPIACRPGGVSKGMRSVRQPALFAPLFDEKMKGWWLNIYIYISMSISISTSINELDGSDFLIRNPSSP